MPEAYPHIRRPLRIAECEIPNRIARTAHATGFPKGVVNDRLIRYHEARARGGVGLVIAEIASVHDSSPGPIEAQRDGVIPGLARLADAVHAHGTKIFQQLWHGGAHGIGRHNAPAWAPSPVPSVHTGRVPLTMTRSMIDDVVAGFAAAAARCAEAGMDGVEIHGAHGYLVGQFLSPLTNRRDDEYGGDTAGRTRFAVEVLSAVRSSVPAGFPVGIRLAGTESAPGGLEPPEVASIAAHLDSAGLVDFVDLSMGSYYAFPKMIGPMHEPLGYELESNTPVLTAVAAPTIVTGRIMDLHDAEQIIASGRASMVSMVRATIADPNLVALSLAGHADRVRPCLSCNQGCVGGLYGSRGSIGCTVNPDVGTPKDGEGPEPSTEPRHVVVIGGGPGGMEAACTAARRGHRVTIHEAQDRLGGTLRLARLAPHRQDIAAHADWLESEMRRLGVEVVTHSPITADDLDDLDADVLVVATGAEPRRDGLQRSAPHLGVEGVGRPHVCTPHDVLAGSVPIPRRALVFDDMGHVVAASTAEHLVERSTHVTFATSHPTFAPHLGTSLQRDPLRERLVASGRFELLCNTALVRVGDDRAVLRDLSTGVEVEVAAELVVVDTGALPRRELAEAAEQLGIETLVVGDANDPADLQVAIATGRRAGLSV